MKVERNSTMLGTTCWNCFTFHGSSPKIQQCMKEQELCKTSLTCHVALDVIYIHGVVTVAASRVPAGTKGEAGASFGGRAQLLLRPTETPC